MELPQKLVFGVIQYFPDEHFQLAIHQHFPHPPVNGKKHGQRALPGPQDIANLSWAYASLGMVSMKLIDTLSEVMLTSDVVSTFNSQVTVPPMTLQSHVHRHKFQIMRISCSRKTPQNEK